MDDLYYQKITNDNLIIYLEIYTIQSQIYIYRNI